MQVLLDGLHNILKMAGDDLEVIRKVEMFQKSRLVYLVYGNNITFISCKWNVIKQRNMLIAVWYGM